MKGYIMQEKLTDQTQKPTNKIIIQRQDGQSAFAKTLFFCLEALMVFWWSIIKTVMKIAGHVFGFVCNIIGRFLHIKLVEPWQDFFLKTSGLYKFYTLAGVLFIVGMVAVSHYGYLSAWG
ncbi:hypothetical protein [Caudoviricetes sp.]|nr:hypothetical protein [Caudoviricetes sp.]